MNHCLEDEMKENEFPSLVIGKNSVQISPIIPAVLSGSNEFSLSDKYLGSNRPHPPIPWHSQMNKHSCAVPHPRGSLILKTAVKFRSIN
jgi:hypothetical protein